MTKNCILVANNPGGFNSLFPVIRKLTQSPIQFSCFIVGYGRKELDKAGVSYTIMDQSYDIGKIKEILSATRPGVIVTGSSFPHTPLGGVENIFIQAAKSLEIPTISILDHWFNYRLRFSSDFGKTLDRIPDLICVMDDHAKKEMLKAGFPEGALLVTGNPYLERLHGIKKDIIKNTDSAKLRNELGFAPNDFIVTFISEPVSKDHEIKEWGYDEDVVLRKLIDVLEKSAIHGRVRLVVKPHPREDKRTAEGLHNGSKVSVSIYDGSNVFELLGISQLIIGMTSMLLIEAHLLGLKCISFQPGRAKRHRLPFQIKIINSVTALRNFFHSKTWEQEKKHYLLNASQWDQATLRIFRLIEQRIFSSDATK